MLVVSNSREDAWIVTFCVGAIAVYMLTLNELSILPRTLVTAPEYEHS